jgi:hypothetical protein
VRIHAILEEFVDRALEEGTSFDDGPDNERAMFHVEFGATEMT